MSTGTRRIQNQDRDDAENNDGDNAGDFATITLPSNLWCKNMLAPTANMTMLTIPMGRRMRTNIAATVTNMMIYKYNDIYIYNYI